MRKGGARPGDRLLLTKRLGTGVLVSGSRQGRTAPEDLAAAVDQMRTFNRAASEVLVEAGVAAATDVTGFGLLGHGLEMARASGTRFVFEAASLPVLAGALELAAAGVETGGAAHNRRFVADALTVADAVPPQLVTLAHDPQTSGGLLAAIPPDRVDAVEAALAARRRALVDRLGRGRRGRHRDRRTDLAISGRTAHPVGGGARHARAMRQRIALAAIKAVHTVAFFVIATSACSSSSTDCGAGRVAERRPRSRYRSPRSPSSWATGSSAR